MRNLTEIVIHCTATPEGREVTYEDLWRWHVEDRGWSDIGYHFMITLEGDIVECRHMSKDGAHVKGHNKGTVGISYAGGVDTSGKAKDTRTSHQKAALTSLISGILEDYPSITKISGHRDYAAKACPSFDAKTEYAPLLERKPLKPVFNNPKDDDDPDLDEVDAIISDMENGNFAQKQGRDKIAEAADYHWRALEAMRKL